MVTGRVGQSSASAGAATTAASAATDARVLMIDMRSSPARRHVRRCEPASSRILAAAPGDFNRGAMDGAAARLFAANLPRPTAIGLIGAIVGIERRIDARAGVEIA